VGPRLPRVAGLIAGAAGFATTLAPYLLHVRGYLPGAGLGDLLRFERFQATPGLARLELLVATDGPWEWLRDRARGFLVAFDEGSAYSYFKAFGAIYWSVPLALLVLGAEQLRAARAGERPWRRLVAPDAQHGLFLLVFATGWFLSLHVLHKATFTEWNFAMRHALPCLFLFGMGTVALLRRAGLPRLLGTFLLAVTVHRGVGQVLEVAPSVRLSRADLRSRDGIVRLLGATVRARGPTVVATPRAQRLAAWTEGVGLHGIYEQTTLPELLHMVDHLGVTLLAVPDDGEQPALLDDPALAEHLLTVLDPPDGWRLWIPRAHRPATLPTTGAPDAP
jgi:hypothetical protein